MRLLLFALVSLPLVSCVVPRKLTVVDAPYPERPTIRSVRAEGDTLRVTVKQDTPGAWIAGVKAETIQGDVYLHTVHISSAVHATEFPVDLSGKKFPDDWRKRLYWMVGDSIGSPVNPFIVPSREIRRSKIEL